MRSANYLVTRWRAYRKRNLPTCSPSSLIFQIVYLSGIRWLLHISKTCLVHILYDMRIRKLSARCVLTPDKKRYREAILSSVGHSFGAVRESFCVVYWPSMKRGSILETQQKSKQWTWLVNFFLRRRGLCCRLEIW